MSTGEEPRRYAQVIKLKPDQVDEYMRIHNPIPEAIARRIRECNIVDYSIFHSPQTDLLFATFKYTGRDVAADMARMREDPDTLRWWKVTDAMQESLNPHSKGSTDEEESWWTPCPEVFRQG